MYAGETENSPETLVEITAAFEFKLPSVSVDREKMRVCWCQKNRGIRNLGGSQCRDDVPDLLIVGTATIDVLPRHLLHHLWRLAAGPRPYLPAVTSAAPAAVHGVC